MYWSQQTHDDRAILDLLPDHKGLSDLVKRLVTKLMMIKGDIRHAKAPESKTPGRSQRQPSRDKRPKSPHDIANR